MCVFCPPSNRHRLPRSQHCYYCRFPFLVLMSARNIFPFLPPSLPPAYWFVRIRADIASTLGYILYVVCEWGAVLRSTPRHFSLRRRSQRVSQRASTTCTFLLAKPPTIPLRACHGLVLWWSVTQCGVFAVADVVPAHTGISRRALPFRSYRRVSARSYVCRMPSFVTACCLLWLVF